MNHPSNEALTHVADSEILRQILLFCLAGLLVSVLMLTYGLDLSPGFF